jgi:dTDP-4-dehydrorhamnose reductase
MKKKSKILITGGTGRLATELKKHLDGHYVGSKELDFTQNIQKGEYDLILHIGAYTNVRRAEFEDKEKCFMVNVYGTFNLVQTYKDVPFIYISTESAQNPPFSVYSLTKKLGEEIVKTHPNHLILRTLFKPNPFPFQKAYVDQYTQGDYVDVIAKLLAKKVKGWDRKTCKLEYLGTGRKTIFELAKRTRPEVEPNHVDDYIKEAGVAIPKEYE